MNRLASLLFAVMQFSGPVDLGPNAIGVRAEMVKVDGRQVQMLVWYPARAGGSPMTFGALVDAACVPEGQPLRPVADCRARWLRDLLEYRPTARVDERVFTLPTRAALNADRIRARFPVVVFDGGLRSDALSYFSLAEYLASHGIVAISVPSTPVAPEPSLTFDVVGVRRKARIVRAALDASREWPDVDPARAVVAAWSVDGVSTVIAAIDDPRIRGVLSLDGGVGYDYGLPLVREVVSTRRTAAPALHISGKAPNPFPVTDQQLVRVGLAEHDDAPAVRQPGHPVHQFDERKEHRRVAVDEGPPSALGILDKQPPQALL
jgi:hypothetical protein